MAVLSKSKRGKIGEELARDYLTEQGLVILESNYRCERAEVDIVAEDGETLVFCEVKLRLSDQYGPPEVAVTPRKQRRVRLAALGYLAEHEIEDRICRFDVLGITRSAQGYQIHHIKNAF